MAGPTEEQPSRTTVVLTVGGYMVAGLIMVTVNKAILNQNAVPIFTIFVQLVIAVICLAISHVARVFVIPTWDQAKAKALWKLVVVNVLGLSLNNLCLQYVDAGMYQVARGLILPITVLFTFLLQASPPSRNALLACAVVTVGFFIGVLFGGGGAAAKAGSVGVSPLGIFFGLLSSVTTAGHAIIIKASLPIVDGSAMDLAWYSNALSAVVILPLCVLGGELPALALMMSDSEKLRSFLVGGFVTGVVGFAICLAGFLSIKVTSPVSHMVSSAARGILQTIIGVVFLSEIVTGGRALSIFVTICGSCGYVWVKAQEQNKPAAPAYTAVSMDEMEEGKATSPRDFDRQS